MFGGIKMQKKRKVVSIVSLFAMMFMLLSGAFMSGLNSKAATVVPQTAETAQELELGKTYSKSWDGRGKYVYAIWHKVTLPSSGKLNVTVTHPGADDQYFSFGASLKIHADINSITNSNTFVGSNTAFSNKDRTFVCDTYLDKGTYWICIDGGFNAFNGDIIYDISTSFTSTDISFEESYTSMHNSPSMANSINIDKKYVGQMSLGDTADYYKFSVSRNCYVKLSAQIDLDSVISSNSTNITVKKNDANFTNVKTFSMPQDEKLSEIFYLDKGTYYLEISDSKSNYYLYDLKISNINVGWITNTDGTMSYYDMNGKIVKDAWLEGYDGEIRYVNANGIMVTNQFVCDGTYTYFLQADGSPMKDRLTYHPDGVHVIYFDENGHEVFSDFAHVKKNIEGNPVDDYCFFDVNGYLYVDVVTYDKEGKNLYYANPYGVLERGKWFQFSNTVMCADGTPWAGAAGGYGYANADGTLMVNTYTYDWQGRYCYMQGNGVALY